jgi:mono/diheme cytochrome c family protein
MFLTLVAVVAIATLPTVALGDRTAKVVGNPKAGKPLFVSTCAVCHTLSAAAALGKIGPNLDRTRLTQAVIIKAITDGGASVMSKAATARYTTHMPAYKGVLSPDQIKNVSAYVYLSTHA